MQASESKTIADYLREAADLLEEEGAWCQGKLKLGSFTGNKVSYCALGAIDEVVLNSTTTYSVGKADIRNRILVQVQKTLDNGMAISAWNDQPQRRQQEVVDALRLAAKRWEEDNE